MAAQSTDPVLSKRKFEREVAEYRSLGDQYRQRGWFLVEAEFPNVLVVLAAPQLTPAAVVMGVAFDYSNYDASPPSVRLVNPFTAEPYKMRELPTPLNRALPQEQIPLEGLQPLPALPAGARMIFRQAQPYMQAFGPDEIPFLCIAGVREYHEHPAHSGDLWELHRANGAGRLVRILEIISKYGIEPIPGFGVQLVPQVTINFGMPPE